MKAGEDKSLDKQVSQSSHNDSWNTLLDSDVTIFKIPGTDDNLVAVGLEPEVIELANRS